MSQASPIRVFLCGDVMTGRGIDQILPHPVSPVLYEPLVRDAREYVRLAEAVSGPIPRLVDPSSIWGDSLLELQRPCTDARIINLETSITTSDDYWPNKQVLYRMHPRNIECIKVAGIDCCCLANNHVLDWGYAGLAETIQTLRAARIQMAGAGIDLKEAAVPAVIDLAEKGRVLVFAFGSSGSGIECEWAATEQRPGVSLLPDLSLATAVRAADMMRRSKQSGDILIASIHWGSNWGYEIPQEQIDFAHQLVAEGVDLVYGHSSHHVRPMEVYRNRLILYGCGDFLTDYEGIRGHEQFRGDLSVMYLVDVDPSDGHLVGARLVPMQMRRLQVRRASPEDAKWLSELLHELCAPFGTDVQLQGDQSMILCWP